jgi:hypothetical protein
MAKRNNCRKKDSWTHSAGVEVSSLTSECSNPIKDSNAKNLRSVRHKSPLQKSKQKGFAKSNSFVEKGKSKPKFRFSQVEINNKAVKASQKQPIIRRIDLRPAKKFTEEKMAGSPIAQALARQPDKISVSLFLELLPLLLQLGELKKTK